jgi:hypothetical protein
MGDTLKTLAATLAVQMLGSMAVLTVPVLAPAAARDVGVPAAYVELGTGWLWSSHRSARGLELRESASS